MNLTSFNLFQKYFTHLLRVFQCQKHKSNNFIAMGFFPISRPQQSIFRNKTIIMIECVCLFFFFSDKKTQSYNKVLKF